MSDYFESGAPGANVPAQLFDRFENSPRRDPDMLSRDLADLLGARRSFPGDLPGILGWGLPGMAGFAPGSDSDRERVAGHIQTAIRRYEPRLANVRVTPAEDSGEFAFVMEANLANRPEGVRVRIVAPRRGGALGADVTWASRAEDL